MCCIHKKWNFNNIYFFTFVLWYSTKVVFNTTIGTIGGIPADTIKGLINLIVFALLSFQIALLLPSFVKKKILLLAGITMLIFVSTVLSGDGALIFVWMFIAASKNKNWNKLIEIAYIILLVMVPVIAVLSLVGVIEDKTIAMRGVQRFSLGFSHPNQLGLRIFQLVIYHCYLNKGKFGWLGYFFIILAIAFAYKIPNSQTACICLAVFLLLILAYKFIEGLRPCILKTYARVLLTGTVLVNVFSILLSAIDVNKNILLSKVNEWMSARFSLCHKVWQIYGISFLGQKVHITEKERELAGVTEGLWLDNAYVSILLRYGILVYLLFSIAYIWLVKYVISKKNYILVTILFLYALYGVMENGFYTLIHNVFLIMMAVLLYKETDTEIENTT